MAMVTISRNIASGGGRRWVLPGATRFSLPRLKANLHFWTKPEQALCLPTLARPACLAMGQWGNGAMGQKKLAIDAHANPDAALEPNDFKVAYTLLHAPLTEAEEEAQKADSTYPYHQYGNPAREGISCAVCHHIAPP